MSYSITKYQDVFTINNTDAINSLSYVLTKLNGCYDYSTIEEAQVVSAGSSFIIPLKEDGEYKLNVTQDAVETEAVIKYYLNLQKSLIEDVDLVLCGCDCNGCEDCATDCNDKLTTILKILSFIALTSPQYSVSLDKVSEVIKCLLAVDVSCLLINEKITGESDNSKVLKQIIAIYYLAIYFLEKIGSADDEELDYINEKFKFNIISPCISKLGIDIAEVEEAINNNMGSFTINSAAYVNQPPDTIGDNTIAVDNRATTILTLAMFTTGTTPPYNDPEGDPADAVRIDTLPADGVLRLNGVAVTAGQIIPVANINANELTYESPDQDALDADTFTFSIRDTGSLIFSS